MRINVIELRDMIATAVRQTIAEARKKPKIAAARSEESIAAQRERQLRGLPGHAHGRALDMSKPLGKRNLVKRQGASGMGNWTSESRGGRAIRLNSDPPGALPTSSPRAARGTAPPPAGPDIEAAHREFDRVLWGAAQADPGVRKHANDIARAFAQAMKVAAGSSGNIGPEESNEALRHLVRLIVSEEIRLARGD
jgi:hypothetical protein